MRYDDIPRLANWKADTALLTATSGSQDRVAALRARFQPPAKQQAPTSVTPPVRDPKLAPIDNLVGLCEKAWSTMAKLNVLRDLKAELDKWEKAHPGQLHAAMQALVEVTDRKWKEASPGAGQYKQVYCVGWKVGCNYDVGTGVMSPDPAQNPDYFRHSPDDRSDKQTKCGEMMKAITAAGSTMPQNVKNDPKILKIFMAPEFFFRGQNGAYSPDIVSDIIPEMRRRGTANAVWKDWLFVFGTAVAAIETAVTYCSTCGYGKSKIKFERDPNDKRKTVPKCDKQGAGPAHNITTGSWGAEVQNVALIQKGTATHMVVKEYVSGIDYVGNEVTVAGGQKLGVRGPAGGRGGYDGIKSTFDDERMGGCLFTVDGVRIGLEVCLDHSLGKPKQPMTGRADGPLSAVTQILLIPSYGMEIGTGLYCMAGGVAFNVDGRGQGNSEVLVKGAAKQPQPTNAAAGGGRGSLDLWGPFNLPY